MEGEDDKPSLGDGEEGRGAEEGKYGKLSVFTFVKIHVEWSAKLVHC